MKKIATLLLAALLSSAHAGENEIRKSLQNKFPQIGPIEHIVKTPYSGLYEVVIEDQLYYIDSKGEYLFEGNIIETKSRRNLSGERRRILFAVDFNKLPLNLAITKVRGNGQRKLAIFTDPNCSYCQALEKELSSITDVTLYLFLYPIFPGSDEIVHNVLCSENPIKAWDNWMLSKIVPAKAECQTKTDEVLALGQKLHINGTPNLIFANGIQSPGLLRRAELEKNLDQAVK